MPEHTYVKCYIVPQHSYVTLCHSTRIQRDLPPRELQVRTRRCKVAHSIHIDIPTPSPLIVVRLDRLQQILRPMIKPDLRTSTVWLTTGRGSCSPVNPCATVCTMRLDILDRACVQTRFIRANESLGRHTVLLVTRATKVLATVKRVASDCDTLTNDEYKKSV